MLNGSPHTNGNTAVALRDAALTVGGTAWLLHFIGYSGDNLGLIYLCGKPSWLTVILYTIIVCVLIFKHKSNFKRLINGTENCFKHKKNKNQ